MNTTGFQREKQSKRVRGHVGCDLTVSPGTVCTNKQKWSKVKALVTLTFFALIQWKKLRMFVHKKKLYSIFTARQTRQKDNQHWTQNWAWVHRTEPLCWTFPASDHLNKNKAVAQIQTAAGGPSSSGRCQSRAACSRAPVTPAVLDFFILLMDLFKSDWWMGRIQSSEALYETNG